MALLLSGALLVIVTRLNLDFGIRQRDNRHEVQAITTTGRLAAGSLDSMRGRKFLWAWRYANLAAAAGLALLRLAVLPAVALAAARVAGIGGMERTTLVLMSGMPAAVSLIVFAERYRFYPETIASLILISSLGGALTLNAWAAFLAR